MTQFEDEQQLVQIEACIRRSLPDVRLVYLFGSRAEGSHQATSDWDIAILGNAKFENLKRWILSNELANMLGQEVDLVDLLTASTVLQNQIISKGQLISGDHQVDLTFQTQVLSMYQRLQESRKEILDAYQKPDSNHQGDVIVNKLPAIDKYLGRIDEEYQASQDFRVDFTRQDSVILNIQRACEAAIDIANALIKRKKLGVPQSARDSFELLSQGRILDNDLALKMKNMVGLRNVAVHDYQALNLDILIAVVNHHLSDFRQFSDAIKLDASLTA